MAMAISPGSWQLEIRTLAGIHLGDIDVAEATISAAQVRKRIDASFPGYDDYLEQRFRAVLPHCLRNKTKIVSNPFQIIINSINNK